MADKQKKSQRLHKDKVKMERQLKIAKANGIIIKHPNKLKKKHATSCGRAGCMFCGNPRRTMGEKTIQERRFEQD
jgi:hypothetical protein